VFFVDGSFGDFNSYIIVPDAALYFVATQLDVLPMDKR
jgi:hypothetical protein